MGTSICWCILGLCIEQMSLEIGAIKKLFKSLPRTRNALLTIYKLFVRPHLDYGDIDVVYDRPNNEPFISKLE